MWDLVRIPPRCILGGERTKVWMSGYDVTLWIPCKNIFLLKYFFNAYSLLLACLLITVCHYSIFEIYHL